MLLLSRVQRRHSQALIWTKCCSQLPTARVQLPRGFQRTTTQHGATTYRCSSLQHSNSKDFNAENQSFPPVDLSPAPDDTPSLHYREQLRRWDTKNAQTTVRTNTNTGSRHVPDGVVNNFDRSGTSEEFWVAPVDDGHQDKNSSPFTDVDGFVDFASARSFLLPGDMVAIKSFAGEQEIAIFVRNLEHQSQFYTMSGRYLHTRSSASDFFIPGFVRPEELDDVKKMLPVEDVPQTLEDKLQSMGKHIPSHIGRPLLEKMIDFQRASEAIFRKYANRLDNAHNILGHQAIFGNGTLRGFAKQLLLSQAERNSDDSLPAAALFATYQALSRDDAVFRVHQHGRSRLSTYIEVSPIQERKTNLRVTQEVHKYQEDMLNGTKASTLHQFIQNAQLLIDKSRQSRSSEPSGIIGPYEPTLSTSDYRSGNLKYEWTTSEAIFPSFMESWAALNTFSLASPLNGIGSAILRATGRYDNHTLDRSTAWKFLQEIGFIPPWETLAAYHTRIPGTGCRLRSLPYENTLGMRPDNLQNIRKERVSNTMYCVDEVTAMEIDDGVSVEPTSEDGEYWVRIHIADPASHLEPRGPAAHLAASITGNIYLQDRVTSILAPSSVASHFSLEEDRPCITFSAKMNLEGDILEIDIAAEKVGNIVYMTPSLFAKVGEDHAGGSVTSYAVGNQSAQEMPVPRYVAQESDLTTQQAQDLKILHQIARARDEKLIAKGGLMFHSPNPTVSASFGGQQWQKMTAGTGSWIFPGDPAITVKIPTETDCNRFNPANKMSAVARLMLIANEVAARWCHERGIPIPYRVTHTNPEDDPLSFFKKEIEPLLQRGEHVNEKDMRQYFSLIGFAQLSATPGPHRALGVDMIAKATSPLRRYPDLLVHWQIGAALLQEAATGKSLIGNTNEDFLPFSRPSLERKFPRIDMRERAIKAAHNHATRAWLCQFLIRAWRFNQAVLPSPLRVRVVRGQSALDNGRWEKGMLTNFLCTVDMKIPEGMSREDIQHGDEFEVELTEVDAYTTRIEVNAVKRWVDDG